ncbi:hypothetical protein MUA02_04430 [Enterobacteriaceae bacterium H20N1]|uniref:Uncharacterized protein n=1 Tax=Dryocola boscaweniae TaxID=2925397 RepID=A0A9X2W542_9ENTR|nr:hypothetical protein [Dryocola boscaweniae]MCT4701198.1 hypothetical protein [Dryocola boscaweniae]MCT4718297.1 hypothetical protein [Dryocola boscaweniae]
MFHDAPRPDAACKNSLAPESVREEVFWKDFCAMVVSVAQQVQVVQAYE